MPEEVNTLMKTLESDVQASRNRLRDDQEKFENLPKEIKVTQTCEIAGFMRKSCSWNASGQSTILTMDLEEKLEHAESTHHLMTMMILSQWDASRDRSRTKQQELSGPPVNPPFNTFIPIDQRKWNDTPGVSYVQNESESLACRVSNKVTRVSRHRGLHREYDGAIDGCSVLLLLRSDSDNEGAGDFSDSQWLSLKHRGSDKTRCQYCLGFKRESQLSFRALRSRSGGALVVTTSELHLRRCTPWRQAGLVASGNDTKEGWQTVFLTALDPQGQ